MTTTGAPPMNAISRTVCISALVLWVAALVFLGLVIENVTYTICDGPLLHIPPGTIHWPPSGQNLELLTMEHDLTLAAVVVSISAAFLTLFASPRVRVMRRVWWFIGTTVGSCLIGIVLWLINEAHVLHAHVDALVQCL